MEALHGEAPPFPTIHARVEVFSAQLIALNSPTYRGFRGAIILHSCYCYCAIFQCIILDPPQIDSEGWITLNGPEHTIPVKDKIIICPWFIVVGLLSHMNKEEAILWRAHSDGFNKLISRTIQVLNDHYLDINFAVYNDPVEAHLDVCLVDMEWGDADGPVHICGTVSCSYKVVPQSVASSVLFDRVSGNAVCIKPNESTALPLSRRMVVVPRTSPLHVHVCLAIGSKSEDASVAKGEVVFSACSDTEDDSIIIANHGKVSVKVTWM